MRDRRFEFRVDGEDQVAFRWEDHLGRKHEGTALLADISPSGASVQVDHAVRIGTKFFLGYQDQELSGKVSHCAQYGSGYRIGIRFQTGSAWSPRRPRAAVEAVQLDSSSDEAGK
jgi:hypothetical protein